MIRIQGLVERDREKLRERERERERDMKTVKQTDPRRQSRTEGKGGTEGSTLEKWMLRSSRAGYCPTSRIIFCGPRNGKARSC